MLGQHGGEYTVYAAKSRAAALLFAQHVDGQRQFDSHLQTTAAKLAVHLLKGLQLKPRMYACMALFLIAGKYTGVSDISNSNDTVETFNQFGKCPCRRICSFISK